MIGAPLLQPARLLCRHQAAGRPTGESFDAVRAPAPGRGMAAAAADVLRQAAGGSALLRTKTDLTATMMMAARRRGPWAIEPGSAAPTARQESNAS